VWQQINKELNEVRFNNKVSWAAIRELHSVILECVKDCSSFQWRKIFHYNIIVLKLYTYADISDVYYCAGTILIQRVYFFLSYDAVVSGSSSVMF
jgi:hypothetical protein